MKYFMTGATGFIGGRVARQLIEAGHEVAALARTPAKARDLSALGVSIHEGDITDKESMRLAMTGAEGVFHIAAWYKIGAKDNSEAERVNVGGTRNVLELMKELGIPKGVYTSTLAVFSDTGGRLVDETYRHDGPWLSEYDRTKWLAHYEVALHKVEEGLPLVIVQPGLVYGPGDESPMHDALIQYLEGKLPMIPRKTAFCWAHVDDTARGHLLAMEKGEPGESYIIAGPVYTFQEAFEMAEKITGIKAPGLHAGPGMLKAMSSIMKVVGAVIPLPATYSAESLRVVAGVTYIGSNERARRELGFEARPLEEGLRETLLYEMERLGLKVKAASA
ncbi:MAG: NAD-dependent epimerase/dehydratase family protein [Blastocatellia bacterium]|nr:NAD-dependent epimerase/dehydratase family protein [Blastocatellia bacterium]